MKVLAASSLVFVPGRAVSLNGWRFQAIKGEVYISRKTHERAQLLAALGYIATLYGVDLAPESVHPAPARILDTWHREGLAAEIVAVKTIKRAKQGAKAK